jgi:hypothetical protein
MMKINRIFEDENVNRSVDQLYHIIHLQYHYQTNEITIVKKINYLYGHGQEQCDKIYCCDYYACYKTQNLEYLNDNENEIIQDLINEIYSNILRNIQRYKIERSAWEKRIKDKERHKKNFSVFIRKQKLERILNI